ncbi:hypothetical protein AAC387_Pa03g1343 [Persea americana]
MVVAVASGRCLEFEFLLKLVQDTEGIINRMGAVKTVVVVASGRCLEFRLLLNLVTTLKALWPCLDTQGCSCSIFLTTFAFGGFGAIGAWVLDGRVVLPTENSL